MQESSLMNIDRFVRDRARLFWTINLAGWTGYTLAAWLGALAHEKPDASYNFV